MSGRQSFAPREFLDALQQDEIARPILLQGMVKPAEDDDQYLLFARGTPCQNWIRIPLAGIETIELVDFVPCKDHAHPMVQLRLRQPETDEGRLFAALVHSTSRRPGGARPARIVRGPRARGSRRTSADQDAVPVARSDFPWCDTVAEYEIGADGSVWCQDYCWESEQIAVYVPC